MLKSDRSFNRVPETCIRNEGLHGRLDVGEFEDFLRRMGLEDRVEDKLSLVAMSAVGVPLTGKPKHRV